MPNAWETFWEKDIRTHTSYPVYDWVEYSKSESGPPGQYLQYSITLIKSLLKLQVEWNFGHEEDFKITQNETG